MLEYNTNMFGLTVTALGDGRCQYCGSRWRRWPNKPGPIRCHVCLRSSYAVKTTDPDWKEGGYLKLLFKK